MPCTSLKKKHKQHLLVVVYITDYDWQKAEPQDDGCGVDNRVKRFEAVCVVPGPVQILLDKSLSADYICKCIPIPNILEGTRWVLRMCEQI